MKEECTTPTLYTYFGEFMPFTAWRMGSAPDSRARKEKDIYKTCSGHPLIYVLLKL
jgi:hypothetical protein